MTGIAQVGAQVSLNALTNTVLPVASSSAPTWVPGLFWVDTGHSNAIKAWNGTIWTTTAVNTYIALLTADPSGLTTVSALSECSDSGYARQIATWVPASSAYPSVSSNATLLQFGPFSINMSLPVQWAAMVTSASGTSGELRETWTLSQQWQVLATQTIDIPVGALTITES